MKTNIKIIYPISIVFIIVIASFGYHIINQNPIEISYEEKFPPLRNIDFGEEFKGVLTPLNNGWFLYKNSKLGFQVEIPSRRILWEEVINNPSTKIHSYHIDLSGGDFEVVAITVSPSRFHTIEGWIENDPEYQNKTQNYVFVRRTIGGINAITKYFVPEFLPPTSHFPDPQPPTDYQLQRATYVIKDDIMYVITTRDISSEKYERIWSSFKFITN